MTATKEQQPNFRAHIAIIDDSRSMQEYVGTLLVESGYEISRAFDGNGGLELLSKIEPDVVLLDVEMPGKTGLQVLDHLKGTRPLFAVILFTTRALLENVVEGLNKGADDYIVKPFRPEELLARVASALRSVAMKRELNQACRQADEALRRLRETQACLIAQKKIQSVASLAAGVAHEINNPLGYIQSNLATLGRYSERLLGILNTFESHPFFSEKLHLDSRQIGMNKLKTIRADMGPLVTETLEGVARIANVVRCFLLLEQGIGTGEARVENVNGIIREIAAGFTTEDTPGVRIDQELAPHDLLIMGVPEMLKMIFDCVIRNAVEALQGEGEIRIRTGRDGTNVCCVVRDSGPGISDADLDRIFDPFFTTKSAKKHIGLGLTIVEHFIQAHDGKIRVTTTPGKGTKVTVSFPAAFGSDAPVDS